MSSSLHERTNNRDQLRQGLRPLVSCLRSLLMIFSSMLFSILTNDDYDLNPGIPCPSRNLSSANASDNQSNEIINQTLSQRLLYNLVLYLCTSFVMSI